MKCQRYEKKIGILIALLLFLLVEGSLFVYFMTKKWDEYCVFQGVVVKNNLVMILLSQKQLDLFYQNHSIYLEDKKVHFQIKNVTKEVLTRKNTAYHEVLISFSFSKEKKENDVIEFSIKEKQKRLIEIFKIIWEGESYAKNQ